MTEPLTPADCDLRDFPYMPLDVSRLRDSDLAIHVSGDEFRAAVLLWCASWHQVPAASLPDDDKALAKLAGYGFAIGEWRKVRDGALRGWIACDDGRLYHPVVAEKAVEAWASKHRHAHQKLCERVRKLNKTRAEKGLDSVVVPAFDDWISAGMPMEKDLLPPENGPSSAGNDGGFRRKDQPIPPENALKGKGEGKGEGNNKNNTHCASVAAPPSGTPYGLMAKLMRQRGVDAISGNPILRQWVDDGITVDEASEAIEIARGQKPAPERIPAAYLDAIIRRQRSQASKGALPPGVDTDEWGIPR